MPDAPASFSLGDLVKAAEREARHRRVVYPALVTAGKMSQAKMDYELALMDAITEHLRGAQAYAERRGK